MTVFPTPGTCAPGPGRHPQVSQSAGKRKGKNATSRGNPYIGAALREAAISAGRTQTFPAPSTSGWSGTCPRRKPKAPS